MMSCQPTTKATRMRRLHSIIARLISSLRNRRLMLFSLVKISKGKMNRGLPHRARLACRCLSSGQDVVVLVQGEARLRTRYKSTGLGSIHAMSHLQP